MIVSQPRGQIEFLTYYMRRATNRRGSNRSEEPKNQNLKEPNPDKSGTFKDLFWFFGFSVL